MVYSVAHAFAKHRRLESLMDAPADQAGDAAFVEGGDDPDHAFAHVSATLWETALLNVRRRVGTEAGAARGW